MLLDCLYLIKAWYQVPAYRHGTICPPSAAPVKVLSSPALNTLTAPVEQLSDRHYKPAVVLCNSQVEKSGASDWEGSKVVEEEGKEKEKEKRSILGACGMQFYRIIFIWINFTLPFFFFFCKDKNKNNSVSWYTAGWGEIVGYVCMIINMEQSHIISHCLILSFDTIISLWPIFRVRCFPAVLHHRYPFFCLFFFV